jgi:hypothetical protein
VVCVRLAGWLACGGWLVCVFVCVPLRRLDRAGGLALPAGRGGSCLSPGWARWCCAWPGARFCCGSVLCSFRFLGGRCHGWFCCPRSVYSPVRRAGCVLLWRPVLVLCPPWPVWRGRGARSPFYLGDGGGAFCAASSAPRGSVCCCASHRPRRGLVCSCACGLLLAVAGWGWRRLAGFGWAARSGQSAGQRRYAVGLRLCPLPPAPALVSPAARLALLGKPRPRLSAWPRARSAPRRARVARAVWSWLDQARPARGCGAHGVAAPRPRLRARAGRLLCPLACPLLRPCPCLASISSPGRDPSPAPAARAGPRRPLIRPLLRPCPCLEPGGLHSACADSRALRLGPLALGQPPLFSI